MSVDTPPLQRAAVLGGPGVRLDAEQVRAFVAERLRAEDLDGRSVCVVVPDGTRSCPLPLLLDAVHGALHGRVSRLTVLIALGTHAAMGERELAAHLGYDEGRLAERYPGTTVLNHAWWDPDTFASVGMVGAERVAELSGGLLRQEVDVRLNRAVVEHDVALVVGPVFPHEVVGFSGGNKYFFPGVAGAEIIDLSHWLGALITSAEIIGTRGITPVRALINEAAQLIPARRLALCLVVESGTGALHAAAYGTPEDAWAAAADVSAETHVRYLDAPVRRVLSVMPEKYQDIWTAAKGFYKLEPVVADGGEVILYAPHVTRISEMHPEIEEIGYHCRDWFTGQWDRFEHLHWGVLAHSTHLRGAGTWDPQHGERCRVTVTLATGIPEDVVRAANLNHLDPAAVDLDAYRADPDTFVVPQAGEVLYRLRSS
ncbi:lactate racemase domain-containing protein [Streptacidiphilus jiangxiensis]|uniref:Nickel-dependent lactate racemase n=1 Tax=Streptacidiphilus jiangxiensis TaxID=235985 RepID=A0A1H7QRL0_STRJI|nr:lactate racemase domain-containing protein [Streptacidiphilus jiangxiensis]SEL50374.1 Nickel-dependent lactate racemase [Streptacidiphilus jiangxiensis]